MCMSLAGLSIMGSELIILMTLGIYVGEIHVYFQYNIMYIYIYLHTQLFVHFVYNLLQMLYQALMHTL